MRKVQEEINAYSRTENVSSKNTAPISLTNLFSITTRVGSGNGARSSIKKKIRKTSVGSSPNDQASDLFFWQQLYGNSQTHRALHFYQLSNPAYQSVLRIQIDLLTNVSLHTRKWHTIIRYCLNCWGQLTSPVIGFLNKEGNQVDLFIIMEKSLEWEQVLAGNKRLLNEMICLQLSLWLANPDFYTATQNYSPGFIDAGFNYPFFVTKAIHDLLSDRRVETIHQLADHLQKHYYIETKYQAIDYDFHDLCFRYENFYWLDTRTLGLDASGIQVWLNFNRLFKGSFWKLTSLNCYS
ncbi:hypothetical protein [Spirosoma humi]